MLEARGGRASTDPSYEGALRALVRGAGGFWASVLVCLTISHTATAEHDGISYFSVRAPTLPIILLGYASVSTGMVAAARHLPDDGLGRRLALPMRCMPWCFLGLLVTPFTWGTALDWAHMTFGVTLTLAQLAVTVWLCTVLPAPRVLAAAGLELLGGVVAAMSMPDTTFNYLLQGELLFNLGFCLCLVAVVRAAASGLDARDDPPALQGSW